MATLFSSPGMTCASHRQDSFRSAHDLISVTHHTTTSLKMKKWNPFKRDKSPVANTTSSPSSSSSRIGRALSGNRRPEGEESARENQNSSSLPPPPAYTAQPTTTPAYSRPTATGAALPSNNDETHRTHAHPVLSVSQASTAEDPYAFLSSFDTVFLIDDSYSMRGSSWTETLEAVSAILPVIFEHDADGPDFYFMNHHTSDAGSPSEPWKAPTGFRNVTRSSGRSGGAHGEQLTVQEIFEQVSPYGCTPTGQSLNHILRHYLRTYEDRVRETRDETCLKPLSIIVITDGAPSDEVGGVIKNAARRLDALYAPAYQVGIQFFQVGNERGAAAALQALDDDLKDDGRVQLRDIVDTVTFSGKSQSVLTGDDILKVVLGSVIKRLDKVQANLRGGGGGSFYRHY